MRIKIIRLISLGLLGLLACELAYLQVVRHRYFFDLSRNNRIRVVPLEGKRGRVLDRNGKIIADNRLSFCASVIPQEVRNEKELFSFLGQVFGEDPQVLFRRYQAGKFAPFAPVVIQEDLSEEIAVKLEENKFRFPGLLIEESFRRFYPFSETFAHVLGYVGKADLLDLEKMKEYGYTPLSLVGKSGVEEYYNQFLRGKPGGLQIEVNSRGQQVRLLGLRSPAGGEDVTLTLDHRLQTMSADLLAGKNGAIIVMDLSDGGILSMVSFPGFDPNMFSRRTDGNETADVFSNPDSPLLNRAVNGQYPPGSIFKIVVSLAGLESNKITPATSFDCPGFYAVGRQQFRCAHTHGVQNLIEGIAHSCNVYFFHLGLMVGAAEMDRYARLLGLGHPTYIDLPHEAGGTVPSPLQRKVSRNQGWFKGDTLNLSIGQGDVLATPLQLVRLMAIVANEGRDVRPHVVLSIGAQRVDQHPLRHTVQFKAKSFADVLRGLRATVTDEEGTAHALDIKGLRVAGKTGTAQTSGDREHHAWFVGYAESETRRIAFCIFLEYGGSSANAVDVAKDLLVRMRQEDLL